MNELDVLRQMGFVESNYNGLRVYYNPSLTSHFNKARNSKSKIVLHHTAGGFLGDLSTLILSKVSTAFLISPEGRIVMLFQPWNWAWHLGKGALGGNETQSKLSIGIEISNWGFLVRKGDSLYTYRNQFYCRLDEDKYDTHVPWKTFNGINVEYFCKYSDAQYEAVKVLKDLLCRLYSIPNVRWMKGYDTGVIPFRGITTHTDFRIDKYDLSPTFDWSRINLQPIPQTPLT
jgi:N-acetyl-anhydromuramyl-L-alanine amidase AmpD